MLEKDLKIAALSQRAAMEKEQTALRAELLQTKLEKKIEGIAMKL